MAAAGLVAAESERNSGSNSACMHTAFNGHKTKAGTFSLQHLRYLHVLL